MISAKIQGKSEEISCKLSLAHIVVSMTLKVKLAPSRESRRALRDSRSARWPENYK